MASTGAEPAIPAVSPVSPAVFVLRGEGAAATVAGGKAGALDRLIAWELPVPPSAVVTTDAYRGIASGAGVRQLVDRIRGGASVTSDEVDEVFVAARLPDGLAEQITCVARSVGAGRGIAVRSSATVEDLAGSSFAGQYRTILGVDSTDAEAVLRAVSLVFASLWHPAPVSYRRALGVSEDDVAMAVLLMQMVPAERAGVAFTVDPNGDRSNARVEAVDGLGEALVSGQVTPSSYVIGRHGDEAGAPDEIARVLELALLVEERARCPQDVEWVWDGDTVWVVQARPITTVDESVGFAAGDGFDSPVTGEELTTAGIGETLPGVLPAGLAQVNLHMLDEAFRRLLSDLGMRPSELPRHPIVRRVRGRAALDFGLLRRTAVALPGGAAEELEQQYFGSRRSGRPTAADAGERGLRGRLRNVAHDVRVLQTRWRGMQDAEVVIDAAGELLAAAPSLEAASSGELLARRARLVDLATRGVAAELSVAAVAASSFRRLELMLEPHLGPAEATAAAEAVTSGHGLVVERHPLSSAGIFAGPTWVELGLAPPRPRVVTAGDSTGLEALEALEARLAACRSWSRSELIRWVRRAALRRLVYDTVHQLGRREAAKAAVLAVGGLVRAVNREAGRRLVEQGALDSQDDVDLLSDGELRLAMAGRPRSRGELARRARWLERYAAEGPLPARFTGRPPRAEIELPPGDRMEGWAASPGRVSGVAQVVASPLDGIEPGRVLVAEATDASWSPLFVDAVGIVLERGGPLSHAAILARELGVPAVLNVAGATTWLDGAEVVVDGDAGVVVRSGER